jgi:hypothetical protein
LNTLCRSLSPPSAKWLVELLLLLLFLLLLLLLLLC